MDQSGKNWKWNVENALPTALFQENRSVVLNTIMLISESYVRFLVRLHCTHRGSQRAAVEWRLHKQVRATFWPFRLCNKRSKSRSDFQGNEGPRTLGRTFIDVSLSFDRLLFNLSGISGELFEHFESAVDSLIKYARLTAMTNLCRRHSTAARWEPLWLYCQLWKSNWIAFSSIGHDFHHLCNSVSHLSWNNNSYCLAVV